MIAFGQLKMLKVAIIILSIEKKEKKRKEKKRGAIIMIDISMYWWDT